MWHTHAHPINSDFLCPAPAFVRAETAASWNVEVHEVRNSSSIMRKMPQQDCASWYTGRYSKWFSNLGLGDCAVPTAACHKLSTNYSKLICLKHSQTVRVVSWCKWAGWRPGNLDFWDQGATSGHPPRESRLQVAPSLAGANEAWDLKRKNKQRKHEKSQLSCNIGLRWESVIVDWQLTS